MENALRIAGNVQDGSEINQVVADYGKLTLPSGSSLAKVDEFVDNYGKLRVPMLEHGLLDDGNSVLMTREIEDFKTKISGTELLRFLMELESFPTQVDSFDPKLVSKTLNRSGNEVPELTLSRHPSWCTS